MNVLANLFWNGHQARLRAGWRIAFHFVLWFAFTVFLHRLVGGSLTMWVTRFFPLLDGFGGRVATFVILLISILVSTWWAVRFMDHRPFVDLGFRFGRAWWLDLLFGLALGAGLMSLVFVAEYLAGWITVTAMFQVTFGQLPFWLAILGPVLVFVCVGVYEELVFRGYQLHNLAEGLNFGPLTPYGAIVLAWFTSSISFGVIHIFNPNASWLSTLYLILAGLFLGLGIVLTGSLAIPIGVHISWNFFQGNVFGFPVSGNDYPGATFIAIEQGGPVFWTGGAFGPEAGLVGILAILAGCTITVAWVRWRHQTVSLYAPLARYAYAPAVLQELDTTGEGV